MKTIVVMNPKGGSGKSTLATNLAGYYANWGARVALADMDAQKTSLAWLRARPREYPRIHGVSAPRGQVAAPPDTGVLILDTPAALGDDSVGELISRADALIIPVLPSPLDIQAAGYFIYRLLFKHRTSGVDLDICVVANRVRTRTRAYQSLVRFIESIDIPFIATLRDSSNYLKAAEQGLSLFDMRTRGAREDMEQWSALTHWLGRER